LSDGCLLTGVGGKRFPESHGSVFISGPYLVNNFASAWFQS
jgi:hypothetical protein